MAKSAEKVAAQAAKAETKAAEKPTASNVAKAVSLSAKAEALTANPTASNKTVNQAGKAAAVEVKNAVNTLKNSGQLEVKLMGQSGLSSLKPEEKAANKSEQTALLRSIVDNGFSIPTDLGLRTAASAYDGTQGGGLDVLGRVNATADLRDSYNIDAGSRPDGNTTLGISDVRLDKAMQNRDETTGDFLGKGPVVKTLNFLNNIQGLQTGDTPITKEMVIQAARDAGVSRPEEALSRQFDRIGGLKIGDRSGDSVNYTTTYFRPNETTGGLEQYRTGRYAYDAPDAGGFLGDFAPLVQLGNLIPGPWTPFTTALSFADAADRGSILGMAGSALGLSNSLGVDLSGAASAYAAAGYNPSEIADFLVQSGANPVTANTLAYTASASNAIGGAFDSVTGKVKDAAGQLLGTPDEVAALNPDQVVGVTPQNEYPVGLNPDEWSSVAADMGASTGQFGNLPAQFDPYAPLDQIASNAVNGTPTSFPTVSDMASTAGMNSTVASDFASRLAGAGMGADDAATLARVLAEQGVSGGELDRIVANMTPALGTEVADLLKKFGFNTGTGTLIGAGAAGLNALTGGGNDTFSDVIDSITGGGGGVFGGGGGSTGSSDFLSTLYKMLLGYAGATKYDDATPGKYQSQWYKSGLGGGRWADPNARAWQSMIGGGSRPYTNFAQGGLARYVRGGTAGQADKIPAMLSDGEYVIDAETVSMLGDGNNEAGASALEKMRQNIRSHKRKAPVNKIPPKAKRPEQYLKGAK